MCHEIANNNMNSSSMEFAKEKKNTKKLAYSIKKALRQLFKQHKGEQLVEEQNDENVKISNSLESLENLRNADIESECSSLESYDNYVNERLSTEVSCEIEDYNLADLLTTVPVHFVRTEHGTFFWTADNHVPVDNDLIEPLYCSTSNQIGISQVADRWAQA